MTNSQLTSLNTAGHFCTSHSLLIAGENWQEFNALVAELTREYKPRTQLDRHWVESAARALWFCRRSNQTFDALLQRLCPGERTPIDWDSSDRAGHGRLLRDRLADQREFERAYRGVEHLRVRLARRRRERRLQLQADANLARTLAQIAALPSKPAPSTENQ